MGKLDMYGVNEATVNFPVGSNMDHLTLCTNIESLSKIYKTSFKFLMKVSTHRLFIILYMLPAPY